MLSPEETRRYARHLVLKGFGGAGQQRLKAGRVLVVGAGGLGSPAIAALAAAGVGHLTIADPDSVSLSNLQRQTLHRLADIGRNKAQSAARFVADLNPHVETMVLEAGVTAEAATALVRSFGVVLDGSDTLQTRRMVAAAAEAAKVPLVSGAVGQFSGQVSVFAPHLGGPRHEALFPTEAGDADLPSCEANGILGPVTAVIGGLMAVEAIKVLSGIGVPLIGRVLLYDAREAAFHEMMLEGQGAEP